MNKLNCSFIVVLMVIAFSSIVSGAIPSKINFQGRLTDPAGTVVTGSGYTMTFRIYDAVTGGTLLWTEIQPTVSPISGIFNVQLGSIIPINITLDDNLWLSIEINADGEMTPRYELVSVPYAFHANVSDNLVCTNCVSDSEVENDIVANFTKLLGRPDYLSNFTNDLGIGNWTLDSSSYSTTANIVDWGFSGFTDF